MKRFSGSWSSLKNGQRKPSPAHDALASVVGILEIYVSGPRLQTALREAGPEVSASYVGYSSMTFFSAPHKHPPQ